MLRSMIWMSSYNQHIKNSIVWSQHWKKYMMTFVLCKKMILMTLLDLSMAFNTVDHTIMMNRLERLFGVTGSTLEWVKSYFSNQYHFASINGANSKKQLLMYVVPRDSMFGPFSFPMYTSPIGEIAYKHNTTQLYVVFKSGDGPSAASQLEECIEEICSWMNANMLKLNNDKTEFLVIGSKNLSKHTQKITILLVGNERVPAESSVRNIGLLLDDKLNMTEHVKSVCKALNAPLQLFTS